jgi:hypothetical protein
MGQADTSVNKLTILEYQSVYYIMFCEVKQKKEKKNLKNGRPSID